MGAAGVVSLDILRDGGRKTLAAVIDLIDETPKRTTDRYQLERLLGELVRYVEGLDWVEEAEVRMREEGHRELFARTGDLFEKAKAFDWRVRDRNADRERGGWERLGWSTAPS